MPIPDTQALTESDEAKIVRAAEALEAAASSLQLENRRSWLARHQTAAVAIAAAFVGIVSWIVHEWTRGQIAATVAPIHEAQEAEIKAVDHRVDAVEAASREQVELLQQNDEDLVDYVLEADRYEQELLDGMAKKLRVPRQSRKDVDLAAKRLRAIKEQRRKR
jgi:hypothetical protein